MATKSFWISIAGTYDSKDLTKSAKEGFKATELFGVPSASNSLRSSFDLSCLEVRGMRE